MAKPLFRLPHMSARGDISIRDLLFINPAVRLLKLLELQFSCKVELGGRNPTTLLLLPVLLLLARQLLLLAR